MDYTYACVRRGGGMTRKSISDLAATLNTAEDVYTKARISADRARAVETAALDDLNAAQKALDEAMAERRQAAPAASDWHRSRLLPVEVWS